MSQCFSLNMFSIFESDQTSESCIRPNLAFLATMQPLRGWVAACSKSIKNRLRVVVPLGFTFLHWAQELFRTDCQRMGNSFVSSHSNDNVFTAFNKTSISGAYAVIRFELHNDTLRCFDVSCQCGAIQAQRGTLRDLQWSSRIT